MITDGNEDAPDRSWGHYQQYAVEILGDDQQPLQWVQLDLGEPHALCAILVWRYYLPGPSDHHPFGQGFYRRWPRAYQDVVVQISNDPAFKTDVTTAFNNDHDNSSGFGEGKDDPYIETSEGQWINPKGAKGRYVRLYSCGYTSNNSSYHGDDFNHYIEVEVYGN